MVPRVISSDYVNRSAQDAADSRACSGSRRAFPSWGGGAKLGSCNLAANQVESQWFQYIYIYVYIYICIYINVYIYIIYIEISEIFDREHCLHSTAPSQHHQPSGTESDEHDS